MEEKEMEEKESIWKKLKEKLKEKPNPYPLSNEEFQKLVDSCYPEDDNDRHDGI